MSGDGLFDWFDAAKSQELLDQRNKSDNRLIDQDLSARNRLNRSSAYSLIEQGPSADEIANAPAITSADLDWYESLPEAIRPTVLRVRFTRVMRRLSACWIDVAATKDTFDDLLLADRSDRAGFPPLVLQELHALRDYYFDELHPSGKGRPFKG
ncbi:MAG: hypothetical protein R3E87_02405 [Burkholderiaceae bacterium]